ncbi:MAG: LamG-like jellyroll fold domain-containing protein, partial [Candidatus Hydrogenedentes bacterium]|nr:LamG-like jellyroll fold domain-containing protein [Candidatus Hydrogenedentota bacterium]
QTWGSSQAPFEPGVWSHIAFSYDGAGTVQFFHNGRSMGQTTKSGCGSISPGSHFLSIGDRVGSYYHGFPGRIDEVRITKGAREFRPLTVAAEHVRTAYLRMEPAPVLQFRLTNMRTENLTGVTATVGLPGSPEQAFTLPELAPGSDHLLEYSFDTSLRPGTYSVSVDCRLGEGDDAWTNRETFEVNILPRKPPFRMPVVMWGLYNVDGVTNNLSTLKDIGFTHCLGLRCDYQRIWEEGNPVPAVTDEELEKSRRMLDEALVNDLGIIISLGVGRWLAGKPEYLRVDPSGKPYERENICCNFPELSPFAEHVGASVAQTYGKFPAFNAALINTEVRDGTQLCFHEHDRQLYRDATGSEFPEGAVNKSGMSYEKIEGFPESRVVPEDHELLRFYRWFWSKGDGWNGFHSAVNNGLKSTGRADLWSFFDPAVRVPPLWGSGGNVDYLSQWTYSYPDPIRIGLATDELFAMAKGGPDGQNVMKMTQIIWYRSQTAPPEEDGSETSTSSHWEDCQPDAKFITIAPIHLEEAFWSKIARPVKGIMYHGWQSLVPTEGGSSYRFTHPQTRYVLEELIAHVVKPLGPMLLQVPAVPADVAFLESFSSAMFAGRGTYGWGRSWGGDAYHIVRYARLQPEIVYEETIMESGLEGYRVLVLADCDVLPEPVVERILAFQQSGGIIVGDERLCPAIRPDVLIEVYQRSKEADVDKEALVARARTLREQLGARYQPYVDSTLEDALPYRRAYGSSDYIFAINDRREFGNYVGHHGLVMENGLPAQAQFTVNRAAGFVYDLVEQRPVSVERNGSVLRIPVDLEPGGGRLWLITEKAIHGVHIQAPAEAVSGEDFPISISVVDDAGTPVDAVIPLEIDIRDPDGRRAEFSGYYGARDGQLSITLLPALNDTPGMWTIEA